jgi:hypothetical protein
MTCTIGQFAMIVLIMFSQLAVSGVKTPALAPLYQIVASPDEEKENLSVSQNRIYPKHW